MVHRFLAAFASLTLLFLATVSDGGDAKEAAKKFEGTWLVQSASGLTFSLTGPNGYAAFTNISGSSSLVTLPSAGTYALIAQGTGGATGSFSFQMAQTSLQRRQAVSRICQQQSGPC